MACIQCNHFDGTRCWKHRFSVCCPDKFECPEIAEKDGGKVITELIKPCPFCGGEAKLNYVGTCIPLYFISCEKCGCKQESSIHKEAVINAWNNRATEAEIRAKAIEEFAGKLNKKFTNFILEHQGQLAFVSGVSMGWKFVDEIAEQLKGE